MSSYRKTVPAWWIIVLIILLTLHVCMVSCTRIGDDHTVETIDTGHQLGGANLHIIVFDSCEYVYFGFGGRAGIAHKGNCKYCMERNLNRD